MIEILNRYTNASLYKSETATSLAECVKQAASSGANLSGADLRGTNLSGANLRGTNLSGANLSGTNLSGTNLYGTNLYGANLYGTNLSGANLSGANLSGANLSGTNLSGANLRGTNLYGTNLYGANLSGANLSGANLSGADLRGTNLSGANLRGTNLSGANLRGTNLYGAKDIPSIAAAQTIVAASGTITGWKKCQKGVIVKLRIPEEARRSNASGRKCRAEYADVIEVIGGDVGISLHDGVTKYIAGTRVTCDVWCEDRWQECAGGIHFYITKEEAEAHV